MSEEKLESNLEQAAIFLMSLSEDDAGEILKHLSQKQISNLSLAMARLRNVEKQHKDRAITKFVSTLDKTTSLGIDSENHIKKVLCNALGPEKAETILDKVLINSSRDGVSTLEWLDSNAVYEVLVKEHPQIQAIILSYLDTEKAADILLRMDKDKQADLILRISKMSDIAPGALSEINAMLQKQFELGSLAKKKSIDGVKSVAGIINMLGKDAEESLMATLKEKEPELVESIAELMFVFENLLDIDDRGIQTLLREVNNDQLILALKGADEPIKEKIFKNMSKRAADLLRDDLEAKGPVKLSEVHSAQKDILAVAKRLAEAGDIVLGGKGGEEMV